MLDVDALLESYYPDLDRGNRKLVKLASSILKRLLHQEKINRFIETNRHLEGLEFNDAVLEHFNFTFRVSNKDRLNLPDQGRVIIVANHPLGSLDGLALLKLVSEIRSDVRIVATSLLSHIEPLRGVLHSVDNLSHKPRHRESMRGILEALEAGQAVIMFPLGEVSRVRPAGVRDGKWKTGFLHLAKRTGSPIVPVHIEAKNSALFYGLSSIYKPLGTVMLVNEMFNKQNMEISLRVGKPIPWESIESLGLPKKALAKRMRRQVYLLARKGRRRKQLFKPVENIIHPVTTRQIHKELRGSELLGKTQDGKRIYLFDYRSNSSVMREIGRLRELSFRQAREGTGNPLDVDRFDRYYRHLILWDEDELEIVGAYRIGEVGAILDNQGLDGLYTHGLFQLETGLLPYLRSSIELGRSFVQPRYQGKRSLDYLWYGIGAYLRRHPEIKYMLGPVSLSPAYPPAAQSMIAAFYTALFGCRSRLAVPRTPFSFSGEQEFCAFRDVNDEQRYKDAFSILKDKLSVLGVKVPALYKQYVELCQPGGCRFLGFNIDPDFSNCVDALILVDLDQVKERKRQRYIESHADIKADRSAA